MIEFEYILQFQVEIEKKLQHNALPIYPRKHSFVSFKYLKNDLKASLEPNQ